MRAQGAHASCPMRKHKVGRLCDSAGRVDHIIYQDDVLTLHIAYYGHCGHNVCLCALLMAEHQGHIEILCIAVGTFCTADIRCGDNHVLQSERLDIGDKYRRCVQVVYRDVESGQHGGPW